MKVEVHCKFCKNSFFREKKRVNFSIKNGIKLFCSSTCSGLFFKDEYKGKYWNQSKSYIDSKKHKCLCIICNIEFIGKTKLRKTCSNKCYTELIRRAGIKGGLISVGKVNRRSKNEILFSNLCKKYFGDNKILENVPFFDGRDADVIIPHLKLAILWNGVYHYKEISKKQTLKQVKNRDQYKLKKIKQSGYTSYIIKDMGSYNPEFVQFEFNKFMAKWVKSEPTVS